MIFDVFKDTFESSELLEQFSFGRLGAGLPTQRFWGRFTRGDLFLSTVAITILAHMARLVAMEAGPLGHQFCTFCLGEGCELGVCVTVPLGASSHLHNFPCIHIHRDDLIAPVLHWGVLQLKDQVCCPLGWGVVISEPQLLGLLVLGGSRSCWVILVEPCIFELFIDCLAFSGFLPPEGQ